MPKGIHTHIFCFFVLRKKQMNITSNPSHPKRWEKRRKAIYIYENIHTLKKVCLQGYPRGTKYIESHFDSRNSAIHNIYHISQCPSTLFKPRHQLLKIVYFISIKNKHTFFLWDWGLFFISILQWIIHQAKDRDTPYAPNIARLPPYRRRIISKRC